MGFGGWIKDDEGIRQKNIYICVYEYRHGQQCGDSQRESRVRVDGSGQRG